jgi:hypothetical protein
LKHFKKTETLIVSPAYKVECVTIKFVELEGTMDTLKSNDPTSMVMFDSIDDLTKMGFKGTTVEESMQLIKPKANLPGGIP